MKDKRKWALGILVTVLTGVLVAAVFNWSINRPVLQPPDTQPLPLAEFQVVLRNESRSYHKLAFSPDGTILAAAGSSSDIDLWDVATLRLFKTLSRHERSVASLAFSPDGLTLASGGEDYRVILWSVKENWDYRDLLHPASQAIGYHVYYTGHVGTPWIGQLALAFNPLGNVLFSNSYLPTRRNEKGEIVLTGQITASSVAHGSDHRLLVAAQGVRYHAISLIPNRNLVAASSSAGIELWDTGSNGHLRTLAGHTGDVYALSLSPNQAWLASGDRGGHLRLWSTVDWSPVWQSRDGPIWSLAFHPTSAILAASEFRDVPVYGAMYRVAVVSLYAVATGRRLETLEPRDEQRSRELTDIAFSPKGDLLVACSSDTVGITVWRVNENRADPATQPAK